LAFQLDGKADDAARWREKAASTLEKLGGSSDIAKLAKFLKAKTPPSIKDVLHVYLPAPNKALFFAALAEQFPAQRERFLAEAARCNFRRKPSYYLVQRATNKSTPEQP
jgi:hypothetical protein